METFRAGTQYGDWIGSVAGDDSDIGLSAIQDHIRLYLANKGLLQEGEYLAGAKVIANIPAGKFKNFTVIYYAAEQEQKERGEAGEAAQMRKFEEDMSPQEFFDRFKRFQFTISPKGAMESTQFCVKVV